MRKLNAFTLVELLLVIALISVIMGLSIPAYTGFQRGQEVDSSLVFVRRAIRTAQLNAKASKLDNNWGVYMSNNNIVVYSGDDHASRATGEDIVFNLPASVSLSGTNEINFSKYTGEPNQTASITLTVAGQNRNIDVNEKGFIQ